MLIRHRGVEPIVDASAFVAPTAVLVGRVSVDPRARVMYGAVLDSEASKVAVGALVHANTKVPSEFFVPPNTIAVGDPLQVYAPGDEGLAEAISSTNFAQTAFGVKTAWEDRIQRYRETAEVRAEEFGSHLDDTVLDDGSGS